MSRWGTARWCPTWNGICKKTQSNTFPRVPWMMEDERVDINRRHLCCFRASKQTHQLWKLCRKLCGSAMGWSHGVPIIQPMGSMAPCPGGSGTEVVSPRVHLGFQHHYPWHRWWDQRTLSSLVLALSWAVQLAQRKEEIHPRQKQKVDTWEPNEVQQSFVILKYPSNPTALWFPGSVTFKTPPNPNPTQLFSVSVIFKVPPNSAHSMVLWSFRTFPAQLTPWFCDLSGPFLPNTFHVTAILWFSALCSVLAMHRETWWRSSWGTKTCSAHTESKTELNAQDWTAEVLAAQQSTSVQKLPLPHASHVHHCAWRFLSLICGEDLHFCHKGGSSGGHMKWRMGSSLHEGQRVPPIDLCKLSAYYAWARAWSRWPHVVINAANWSLRADVKLCMGWKLL